MTTTDEDSRFGTLLRRYRMAASLSQEELAERAGLSRRGISDLERGQRTSPYPATIRRLAEALRLTATEETLLAAVARGLTREPQPATPRHNLPNELSSFVGRAGELEALHDLVGQHRLVTLTGEGGVGKTRLALRLVEDLVGMSAGGTWLVELASVADQTLMLSVVASVLGVSEQADTPLQTTLVEALRERELLIVLDNCEHLVAACAHFAAAVLSASATVRIVATSREPLGVPGEVVWRVPTLSMPDPRDPPSIAQLADYEAVQLFIERARAARPDFAVTDRTVDAVVQICTRLDGIPLALELAAARVRTLSVEQIAERLDDRFRLLARGSRTSQPHHQTLRATMDWSYNLLTASEQTFLARLAVFAGSVRLEAAEAVCTGDGIEVDQVLDLLANLVDKSLVLAEERSDGMGYRLLETVRQYARERLVESGQADAVQQRHAEYFLKRSREAAPHLSGGPNVPHWLERLERERDDVRAVLRWLLARGDGEAAEDFCEALWRFWTLQGTVAEAREWLEALLHPSIGVGRTVARVKALQGLGILANESGNFDAAEKYYLDSLEIAREVGARFIEGSLLSNLGVNALRSGSLDTARELLDRSLLIADEIGAGGLRARVVRNLAEVHAEQGEYDAALGLQSENLVFFREQQDALAVAATLTRQAHILLLREDAPGARLCSAEAMQLGREIGHQRTIAAAGLELGLALADEGVFEAAHAAAAESLEIYRALGERGRIAICLEAFGRLATLGGDPERGVRMIGAAAALRQAIGRPPLPTDVRLVAGVLELVQAALGADAYAAQHAEGARLGPERAITAALEQWPHTQDRRQPGSRLRILESRTRAR